jgi:hypothetical protein
LQALLHLLGDPKVIQRILKRFGATKTISFYHSNYYDFRRELW